MNLEKYLTESAYVWLYQEPEIKKAIMLKSTSCECCGTCDYHDASESSCINEYVSDEIEELIVKSPGHAVDLRVRTTDVCNYWEPMDE